MSRDAELRCSCGQVEGRLRDAEPSAVNRVVCYCDDCQAFLHHLGRAELLDAQGGSDIVQVAPAALSFHRGTEHIRCLRLTPKGSYRWYASCCNTPLGNTVGPAIPFVGIVTEVFARSRRDELFGKPMGKILGQFAIGTPPEGSTKPNLRLLARVFTMVLGWRLRGKSWPHPFFERSTRSPLYPMIMLAATEREALRKLCGPNPTAK